MSLITYHKCDLRIQPILNSDVLLNRLICHLGTATIEIEEDGFKCLVKYIIGQQISDKARETIWKRMSSYLSNVSPEEILTAPSDSLRELGLSGRKVQTIKQLASNVLEGKINFESHQNLSNTEIISILTTVKGIGKWTAEMYLIFSLNRLDILSLGDGTVQRAIGWIYPQDYQNRSLATFRALWQPYATIISAFLWKASALGLMQSPFDEVIPPR